MPVGAALPPGVTVADLADVANDLIDSERSALAARAAAAPPEAEATGFCLYCEEPLAAPRRWCDAACCRGWEALRHREGT